MEKIAEVNVTVAGRRMPLKRVQLLCEDPSLTKQSFAKQSDIRVILDKYAKTGILGDPTVKPIYGDFTGKTSEGYQQSLYEVSIIKSKFERLPSKLKDRFQNDPSQLLDFMADPANQEESITLGLREGAPGERPPAETKPPVAEPPVPAEKPKPPQRAE